MSKSTAKYTVDVKTLLEAGAHFGHRTSRWNPNMRPYIYDKRGGIHIIDLTQTATLLQQAAAFIETVTASGKQVLFVGTKKHIAPTVEAAAKQAEMPYVTQRWFGGILTNFATINKRIQYFQQLLDDLESGDLEDTYNKREILEFAAERDKLSQSFGGLLGMDRLPGALFVTDVLTEKTAVAEANRLGIPVIGIVDSNADPTPIDYPIPANDDARKTVELIASYITEAVTAGRNDYNKQPQANEASETNKSDTSKSTASKSGAGSKAKTQDDTSATSSSAKAKSSKAGKEAS